MDVCTFFLFFSSPPQPQGSGKHELYTFQIGANEYSPKRRTGVGEVKKTKKQKKNKKQKNVIYPILCNFFLQNKNKYLGFCDCSTNFFSHFTCFFMWKNDSFE